MSRTKFLSLHLKLLLSEYGRTNLLGTLAEVLNISEDELSSEISKIDQPKATKTKRTTIATKPDPIEKIAILYPDKADLLRKVYARFQNKEFLAEAKDVKRFLETQGQVAVKIKSRAEATPKVLKVLAELSTNELERLLYVKHSSDYSSLGTIADHILSRTKE